MKINTVSAVLAILFLVLIACLYYQHWLGAILTGVAMTGIVYLCQWERRNL